MWLLVKVAGEIFPDALRDLAGAIYNILQNLFF